MSCWFLRSPAFIVPGKFGDCVQLIGAFHAIAQRTGEKVNVVTSSEFASVFDGCSFVNAVHIPVRWPDGTAQLKQLAKEQFGGGVLLQFWHDTTSPEFRSTWSPHRISLSIHGKRFSVDMNKDPHYSASMWRRAGFSWEEAMNLRPVFDQRNPEREAALLACCWPNRKKPLLLLAYAGQSSPWGYQPEAYDALLKAYRQFFVIHLASIKADRVFDMLTLFEHAAGLITVDSLCLHLAAATDMPYVAFTQNDWLGSVPKGNCVLQIPYNQTLQRLHEVKAVLELWRNARSPSQPMLVSQHA